MPLKDTNCRNARPQDKPYRLYDEQGLYLEVQPNGGRYWRLKYRFLGKEKRLAFGVYPEVGLLDARKKREEARAQLADGHDPSLQKRMAKAVSQFDHQHTFESVAKQWLAIRELSWDPEYTRTVRQRLELNAYPWLGKLPISSISTPMLVENLQRIIKRGACETARRVAQIYKQIFDFSEAAGITSPNQIGNLSRTLPGKRVKHFAAVTDPEKLGSLLNSMDNYSGTLPVCCALKLAPLLFCRPGDLRNMEWAEIDLEAKEWLIPGAKMKGLTVHKQDRADHLVPLSNQAVVVLQSSLEPLKDQGTLFVYRDTLSDFGIYQLNLTVNDKDVLTAPGCYTRLNLKPGTYHLEANHPDMLATEQEIDFVAKAGEVQVLEFKPIARFGIPGESKLIPQSNETFAKVRVTERLCIQPTQTF